MCGRHNNKLESPWARRVLQGDRDGDRASGAPFSQHGGEIFKGLQHATGNLMLEYHSFPGLFLNILVSQWVLAV